ncbi:flavin-containing monooxygenase [Segniliparus rugosus]|uniref:Monooxygenase n=1 Tax=Segniliparus rugosus (strain ATCC BAA-974 / DSM 45345 / CCUG 50838 / CIP 108380 / JCM 13579 / CDC 945) TaxID=679197 RepID=E5XUI5_SEGRC|nr:NAD(P)/FAD-dependent oxidoreductase [Segniliparus rugosus]EFV11964.1 hypothetical protein HMPREF9336_03157 [Segniliparus rugosus ATCC BAA-974]
MTDTPRVYTVVIIGAGPGGITAGVKLKAAGIEDFVIIDRNSDFGGTWISNNYPGLAIDVPGLAFQFPFRRNPDWARFYPFRDDILSYHQKVAEEFRLTPHARFGLEVVEERWNEESGHWEVRTHDGEVIRAQFVISALGWFVNPKEDPGIAGWRDFKGKVLRPLGWDWDYDLAGKRVAVVGTGSSAVQIISSIAPQVERLDVYQRTPAWIAPKPDFATSRAHRAFLKLPGVGAAFDAMTLIGVEIFLRLAIHMPASLFALGAKSMIAAMRRFNAWWVRHEVNDPELAKKLIPDYGFGHKRPALSNEYLKVFNRDNVELVTTPIERITASSVRTADGVEREVDAIVLATGYELFSDPETYRKGAVVGRDGFDLGEFYANNPLQAYQGVMVPGLPNRWIQMGPYGFSITSLHTVAAANTDFAINAIRAVQARGAQSIEVAPEANRRYFERIRRNNRNFQRYFTEFNPGRTYYVNSHGDFMTFRPTGALEHRRASKNLVLDDYIFRPLPAPAARQEAAAAAPNAS